MQQIRLLITMCDAKPLAEKTKPAERNNTPMSLSLYRSLLRSSKAFKDYNLRSYSLRRVRLGFEQARNETDPAGAAAVRPWSAQGHPDADRHQQHVRKRAVRHGNPFAVRRRD
jgi:hypothetical protein